MRSNACQQAVEAMKKDKPWLKLAPLTRHNFNDTMIEFDKYYQRLLEREGLSYSNHSYDRGGATKYGITLETLRRLSIDMDGDGDTDIDDVKLLDHETSQKVYKEEFFNKPKLDLLPTYLKELAFDMAVHFGPKGSVRVIQEAVNSMLDEEEHIAVDGKLGSNTIGAVLATGVEFERVVAFRVKRLAIIFENHYAGKATNIWYGFYNRAHAVKKKIN